MQSRDKQHQATDGLGWSRNQRTACQRCHARKVRCDATNGDACSGCRSSGTPCIAHEKRRRNRGPSRPSTMPMLLPSPSVDSRSSSSSSSSSARTTLHAGADRDSVRKPPTPAAAKSPAASSQHQHKLPAPPLPPLARPRTGSRNAEEVGQAAAVLSSLSAMGSADTAHQSVRSYDNNADTGVEDHGMGPAVAQDAPTETTEAAAPARAKPVDASDGKRHLVEMLSQEDIEHRVMQRGVRIVFVGQEYSNVHYLIRQRARRASASVHHFPSNQISRKFTSHELDRIPREAFELPPKAVVDALLAAYFRYVHPGFPVLDKAAFMGQYRRRDPANPLSLLVLQGVLMVGAHVYRDDDGGGGGGVGLLDDRASLKAAFFRRAKMLFDARFEWNRDVVVQAALLMMWHSEGVEDIGANSYYWVGVAARTALGLGMHRDTRASTLIAHDKRLWRRLWWILVQFDVIVSLSYGRPMAINLAESDVPELEPEELADIVTDDDHEEEDCGIDGEYLIHQMRLSCIIAQTLRDRFGLRTPADQRRQALAEADQRLAVWMARLPAGLRCKPDDGKASSPWSTMLHLTYNNFLILLHRPPPMPTAFTADATSQENMGICTAAAGTIVRLLEAVAARGELRFLNVFAVDALLTTLIQLSAEIRMANPILAGHAMQRFDSAMDILRRLSGIWLNAEIILRLFEDSSERTRSELLIGKGGGCSAAAAGQPTTSTRCEAHAEPGAAAYDHNNNMSSAVDAPASASSDLSKHSSSNDLPDSSSVAYTPHAHAHAHAAQQPLTPGGSSMPADNMHSLILNSTAVMQQQQMVPMNEQLDWTSLYWENSGFASLSPFSDMPLYLAL